MTTAIASARSPFTFGAGSHAPADHPCGSPPHPEPLGRLARSWQESTIEHVRSRNECALIRTLAHAVDVLSPSERLFACWIPCLVLIEEARCRGRAFACASTVAHFIAVNARVALTHFHVRANAPWLVGMSMTDQSAAHLVALLQARRGVSARPWWAPELPKRGSYVMVSTLKTAWPTTKDKRCFGSLSLADEAHTARGAEARSA
jgi:hypothetical protein